MCKWNTSKRVLVTVPSYLSYTGKERRKYALIDSCIADLVKALNRNGIKTIASCCGHGKGQGRIDLADKRILFIQRREERNE